MNQSRDPAFYRWRQMTPEQREATLQFRRDNRRPWHSPPHWESDSGLYLVTAACYEHQPVIGISAQRMRDFSARLLQTCDSLQCHVYAWVVLPNHYHLLVRSGSVREIIAGLGRLHGRTSYEWNAEEGKRGRKVWFNSMETGIKSERHFWASLIYVLHNPVKHGYVQRCQEWPYSNASDWLESVGRRKAARLWKEFPIDDYGANWDPVDL